MEARQKRTTAKNVFMTDWFEVVSAILPARGLFFSFHEKMGEALQSRGALAEWIERLARFGDQGVGFAGGLLNSEQSGVSNFVGCEVFARRLTELFGRLRDVENVVGNLKGEADGAPEGPQRSNRFIVGAGVNAATHATRGDQRRSLGAVDIFESLSVGWRVLRFKIHDLPPDHAVYCAGRGGDFFDDAGASLGGT